MTGVFIEPCRRCVWDALCKLERIGVGWDHHVFVAINHQCGVWNIGDSFFEILEAQLSEYFSGKRTFFSVPLHLLGTDFQKKVWEILQTIPYGETRSYKEQAIAISSPESVRAVANANGMNRISILVPCHRVIGSDGQLTGYGGGIWRKKYLLELESKIKNSSEQLVLDFP